MQAFSPTVRRREVGRRLRQLRLTAGLTIDEVGKALLMSAAKVSRIENAARTISQRDVRDLCRLYGVDAAEQDQLLAITRESHQRSWWQEQKILDSIGTYIDLEEVADLMSIYETSILPGILQTEAYARAVLLGIAPELHDAEARVAVRVRRQLIFERARPPALEVVLDESALHRMIGSPPVMTDQLSALLRRMESPFLDVRLIPFEAGAHPGLDSSFSIVHIGEAPDVVYVEGFLGIFYLHAAADLARYRAAFDRLRTLALTPDESAARIEGTMRRFAFAAG